MAYDNFGTNLGKTKSSRPSIGHIESEIFMEHLEAETLMPKTKARQTQPSWVAWCDRNSKPVKRFRKAKARKLTKWQKKGPMTKKDWKHFCAWAAFRTQPRNPELPKPDKYPCEAPYLPCARKKRKLDKYELQERMLKLAKPRKITKKYRMPERPPTYSPVISWGKPPHRDPGRPFKPPHVPNCFITDELKGEFWAQLRFPVRQAALNGKVTPRLLTLSKPRQYPPIPHCLFLKGTLKPLEVPPPRRKKFTKRGWRLHQMRLLYLSKPVLRKNFDFLNRTCGDICICPIRN
ncbi:LOW QUALITY PROTEIN: uncharacterized protein LOC108117207 [Drosophila eugracilis]|uniref:LOW QUALITY PROTEIN: uncharacterized protein LOC108117207 n=1 Tax=Drosophila eugracilis TaxID=29029 RepID=UPI001BDA8DC3|nr:LOW QUALITY PROTEIN: uncharacterized protein LOC108117207 [Drosophila eugracilis]